MTIKQYRVLPRVVHFEPKPKAETFCQVCTLFVTLFLIVNILIRVKQTQKFECNKANTNAIFYDQLPVL